MRLTTRLRTASAAGLAAVAVCATAAVAIVSLDPGQQHEQQQRTTDALELFGVRSGIAASSTRDLTPAQALAWPRALAKLAPGLSARVVTAGNAAPVLDQMVLWPRTSPTHLIACNESDTDQPGVQRINLRSGEATTILTGLDSCDPVRATAWGTVLVGEEAGSTGAMYEIVNPLSIVGATVDRTTGVATSPKIRRLDAFGFLSYEGLAVLPNGVVYYGDELSPGGGQAGGAYYKFVPSRPWTGGRQITSLDDSPLAAGKVFGLRVGTSSNFGQGFSYGTGSWRPLVGGVELRPQAAAEQLTGYYRPEDIDIDGAALAAGSVRFCGPNTGRDSAGYNGEVICLSDGALADSASGSTRPRVDLLVQGSTELNMPDNIAYQPGRGNWLVHEDGSTGDNVNGARNDDLWSCLDDGLDSDGLSDGCIRVGTLEDLDAEWTGGFFDPTGTHFYVSIQHNSSGFGTVLDVTGWR